VTERPGTLSSAQLSELIFLSDPQLSSDGERAFCVRTVVERRGDDPPGYRAEIVEVELNAPRERAVRVVAGGTDGAEHPRLSPDGRWLAFLAKRGGEDAKQLRLLDMARGGEARVLTELAGGVETFAWRPDGGALAVVGRASAVEKDDAKVVARTVERLHAKKDGLPAPGLRPSEPTGLWFVDVARGDVRRLDAPGDGVADLAWGPDGRTLWLLGAQDADEGDAWRAGLWRLRLDARGRTREALTRRGPSRLGPSALAVTEDGGTLAWLAPADGETLSSPTALWTMAADGGEAERRTGADLDAAPSVGGDARHGRYPNLPVATADGWLLNLNREGASGPALLRGDGRLAPRLDGARVTSAFAHAAGRTLCLVETPRTPAALVLVDRDGSERTLFDPNAELVERYGLVAAEGPFRAANGADGVAWWRLSPRRPRRDHALVVQVHGGPHTNAGFGFSFEHQLLAARGYTVIFANPRGSSSYGAGHATAMLGGYGTLDADDVLAVVDDAVAAHADPSAPVHLTGGSYGGFMTNWLVGRTDRFRSAVTQRSICNWTSFYGTSDIGYRFAEQEVRGTPWDDLGRLWDQSPLKNVRNVTTPILILHAEADHRCPVEQAEQWFVALKRIGRAETRLVRFPGEGHELSRSGRPDRRVRRLDEIVAWFEAHP
jgi:dipeptidyl aminopeptidase/acylaminoacyl peptidase